MEQCPEEKRIERNEKDIQGIWEKIDDLMHSWIPVWVAVVMSVMTFIAGGSLAFAGMIWKISGK